MKWAYRVAAGVGSKGDALVLHIKPWSRKGGSALLESERVESAKGGFNLFFELIVDYAFEKKRGKYD